MNVPKPYGSHISTRLAKKLRLQAVIASKDAERVLPAPDDPLWLTDARVEFAASKAAGLVAGTSTFSLNSRSVTEDIVLYAQTVLRDDYVYFQGAKKTEQQLCKVLQSLRPAGYQCIGASSVIREGGTGLPAGLLTAVRRNRPAFFPTAKATGITTDCRTQWCRARWAGAGAVGLVSCYGVHGSSLPIDTINRFRDIGLATDLGKQCLVESGDWNVCAYDPEKSGILEGFGLSIIWPTNGDVTCAQAAKGRLIDYSAITTKILPLVQSCEIVSCVPCGTHKDVRTAFFPAPEDVIVHQLRRPEHFKEAGRKFSKTGEVIDGADIPSWDASQARLFALSGQYVDDFCNGKVDEYVNAIGIADSTLRAAYDYSLWSCCAEHRALAALGVDVSNISLKRLAPLHGQGAAADSH